MIVVEGDPTRDVEALTRMPLVFKAGVGIDTAKVFEAMKGRVGLH